MDPPKSSGTSAAPNKLFEKGQVQWCVYYANICLQREMEERMPSFICL